MIIPIFSIPNLSSFIALSLLPTIKHLLVEPDIISNTNEVKLGPRVTRDSSARGAYGSWPRTHVDLSQEKLIYVPS